MNSTYKKYMTDNAELNNLAAAIFDNTGGIGFDLMDNAQVDKAVERALDIDLDSRNNPEYLANFARFNPLCRSICIYREKKTQAGQLQAVAARVWELTKNR